MDLYNRTIEEWLKNAPDDLYHHGKKIDFYSKYKNLQDYLEENLYKYIVLGANLKDNELFLNDHGKEHVAMVTQRASELIGISDFKLTPREVFYLLIAIQLHDIGVILGRYEHEQKITDVLLTCSDKFSDSSPEKMLIRDIAKAHGGKTNSGDKDTIEVLRPHKNMDNEKVRSQILAALLRLADELSDDRSRSASWPLHQKLIPSKSEIYHVYSESLHSVTLSKEENAIVLDFSISRNNVIKKYLKDGKMKYLIDEIYDRLLKMYSELKYCSRFLKKEFSLNRIMVNIEFFSDKLIPIHEPVALTLEEKGYPGAPSAGIFDICPNLMENSQKRDGKYFSKKIRKTI